MRRYAFPVAVVILVCFLLLAGNAAWAQSGDGSPPTWYVIQPGAAVGGSYGLTSLGWQVSGAVGGWRYSLVIADRTAGGNQCCCTYLPIILRIH